MVTVGYSRLQQVSECLQWVTAVTAGHREVAVGYSRLPSGYCGLPHGSEWLQWVTAGYSM